MSSGRRLRRRVPAWAATVLLALGLIACGQGAKEEPSPPPPPTGEGGAEEPEPTGLPLRILLRDGAPEKTEALRDFEREHGVVLVFETGPWDPDGSSEYSLVELGYWELGDHRASGRLEALPAGRDWLQGWWGSATARDDEGVWGLPWRGRLHGLRLPSPAEGDGETLASWSTLGRLCQRLGGLALPASADGELDPGVLVSVWLANGGSWLAEGGEVRLDGPRGIEALEFLVRLHRDAPVGPPATLEAHVDGGGLAAGAPRQALDARWIPWPTPDGDHRVVWVEPRLLAIPRQGPHAALAADFLAFLGAESDLRRLGLPEGGEVHGLGRATVDSSRTRVRALPAVQDGARLRRILSESLAAALDRRRSPSDALTQAQERWMTAPLHER